MQTPFRIRFATMVAISGLCLFVGSAAPATATPLERALADALSGLGPHPTPTGVLYDRVLPLSGIERFDGSPNSPPVASGTWRQIVYELRGASDAPASWPDATTLAARAGRDPGEIPIVLLDAHYDRIRPDAMARGALRVRGDHLERGEGEAFITARVFAASTLRARTFRGRDVVFALDEDLILTHDAPRPRRITIDFADGRGFLEVRPGQRIAVRYREPGAKTIRLRSTEEDGTTLDTAFPFEVAALVTPAPDETLHVTAAIPYQGVVGTGNAYVLRAPGHTTLVDPVVVIEGFDLDNSLGWNELYQLLSQQGLLDSLRARGHDLVALDFTDATDYLQRNAFVVETLIDQVEGAISPSATLALVGASMGGLCARYALTHLETAGPGHRVRTFISFDAPHGGANIPLGIQYWVDFFSGLSAEAATLRDLLNRPAARQMLLHHFTVPAGTTGAPDPLRAGFLADLAAVGGFPSGTRTVAIVNGSGAGTDQGFAPAAQVVRYEYGSPFVDITGNVWAVPSTAPATIFNGRTRILITTHTQTVTVNGTWPLDNAPGGSRATMAEMDSVAAPYGDIVALHPSHCFIPTVSALALDTADPFFDIAGTPDLLAHTPFDAVYVPTANQEHVAVTAENAAWFIGEIAHGPAAVGDGQSGQRISLRPNAPNPFAEATTLSFTLPVAANVKLDVFAVDGRAVATLARGHHEAGTHAVRWSGRDDAGRAVPAGVYLGRLVANGEVRVERLIRLN